MAKVLVRASAPEGRARLAIPEFDPVYISGTRAVIIRVLRTYLQSLIGFLLIGMAAGAVPFIDNPIQALDFMHKLGGAASLAVAPAFIAFLHNLVEILANVDKTAPEWRG